MRYHCGVRKEPASNTAGKCAPTKRERHEEEVTDIFVDWKKSTRKWNYKNLRLWARMIANGVHESTKEPPNVLMITVLVQCQNTLSKSHCMMWLWMLLRQWQRFSLDQYQCSSPTCTQSTVVTSTATSWIISPARLADVRMKHYKQLQYLYKLFDDGILDEGEFLEQKNKILGLLRSL